MITAPAWQAFLIWLSGNQLLERLLFSSLELALLAVAAAAFIRLARPKTPRFVALVWALVLIKPPFSLIAGSPHHLWEFQVPASRQIVSAPASLKSESADVAGEPDRSSDVLNLASGERGAQIPQSLPRTEQNEELADASVTRSFWQLQPTPSWIAGLWLIGAVTMLLKAVRGRIQLARNLSDCEMPESDLAEFYRQIPTGTSARGRPQLRLTMAIESPALVGMFRPSILLPVWLVARREARALEWSLRHELAHWKHGDVWLIQLRELVQCLFFFHPAAWWVGRKLEATVEIACDRAVIDSEADSIDYARQLYQILLEVRDRRRQPIVGGLFATRNQISQRFKVLVNAPLSLRPRLGVWSTAGIVLLAAAVLTMGTSLRREVLGNDKNPPTDSAPQAAIEAPAVVAAPEQVDDKPAENPREIRFEVVSSKGEPVEGAKVTAWGVATVGFGSFGLDKTFFPPKTTDAKGIVRIVFPKAPDNPPVKEGDSNLRLLREFDQGVIRQIALRIEHPNHPVWTKYIPVAVAGKIVLADSTTVQIRASAANDVKFLRKNLYPVLQNSAFQEQSPWQKFDWSEEDGLVTIRGVDVSSDDASGWLRMVHIPEQGRALFSSMINLKEYKENPISLRVPMKPGVRVEGRLAENVPRPIKNGKASATIVAGKFPTRWRWHAAAKIEADGSFVFDSLPPDELLQIVTFCDGWVSISPTKEEVANFVSEHGFAELRYPGPSMTRVAPRLCHLDGTEVQTVIPMEVTSSCEVTVLDPNGQPIQGATAGFTASEISYNGGSRVAGSAFDSLGEIRVQLASPDREPTVLKPTNGYTAETSLQGVAVIRNLPPGGSGEPTTARKYYYWVLHDKYIVPGDTNDWRRLSVEILPGETKAVTVRMQAK